MARFSYRAPSALDIPLLRATKQLLFRAKPKFAVSDEVEFVSNDMLCPEGTYFTVIEATYYPFGYYGNFFYVRPAEYRYTVQAWDGRLFTYLRASRMRKRD